MSSGAVPLREATAIATRIGKALADDSLRVQVAGSIRRRKPTVGDIELVAVPRITHETVPTMFEAESVPYNHLRARLEAMIRAGDLAPHPEDPKFGERYAKLWAPEGIQVDLFMPANLDSFGTILLIRTGPAAWSERLVTDARRRGHHFADGELHRGVVSCKGAAPGTARCERVPTPDEAHVFRALGMAYVEPRNRA